MPIEIDLEPGDSKTRECSQIVNGHIVACRWLFPLETTQREGASTSGCLLLLNVSLPQTDRSHPPSSSSHQRNNTHLEVHPSQPQIVQEFFDPVILILDPHPLLQTVLRKPKIQHQTNTLYQIPR